MTVNFGFALSPADDGDELGDDELGDTGGDRGRCVGEGMWRNELYRWYFEALTS